MISQTRTGKGNALACGFAAATGDLIVMFDADGSAHPAEIPAFVAALVAGADFAKGSRFTEGGGSDDITPLRNAGNAGLNLVANTLFGTGHTDLCYGYNAFWADILPVLDLPPLDAPAPGMLWGDGFEIETLLNCRMAAAGLRMAEVPSVERPRIFGETNLRTFADGTRALRTLLVERFGGRRRGKTSVLAPSRSYSRGRRLAAAGVSAARPSPALRRRPSLTARVGASGRPAGWCGRSASRRAWRRARRRPGRLRHRAGSCGRGRWAQGWRPGSRRRPTAWW